jgi:transcriptional regulator with XRE-family HTH domain
MPSIRKPKRQRTAHFMRAWREYRNLSQEQMAGRVDMSRENYSRIENGKVPYNQDILEMAAVALNCSASDLLERDPRIEDGIEELRSMLARASEPDRRRIMAVVKTMLQNNG